MLVGKHLDVSSQKSKRFPASAARPGVTVLRRLGGRPLSEQAPSDPVPAHFAKFVLNEQNCTPDKEARAPCAQFTSDEADEGLSVLSHLRESEQSSIRAAGTRPATPPTKTAVERAESMQE